MDSADEDRHEVDRGAHRASPRPARRCPAAEGRIVPVVHPARPASRSSSAPADKVRAWATATDVHAPPLLECLNG